MDGLAGDTRPSEQEHEETLPLQSAPGLLDGRYRDLRPIAKGSTGAVMSAWDVRTERVVAVKRLASAVSDQIEARFAREIRILATLDVQGVPSLHDASAKGAADRYFVMTRAPGCTLAALLEDLRSGQMVRSMQQRLQIVQNLVTVLGRVHAKDIVHRDLKPDNIVVADDGAVTVVDWGIAVSPQHRAMDEAVLTTDQTILGTPMYMSPEQAGLRNLSVDHRSDLFSIAALAYELLTLEHYLGDVVDKSVGLILVEIVRARDRLAFETPEGASLPADVRAFLERGLQRDPCDRFADAEEMERALADLLGGPPGPPEVPEVPHAALVELVAFQPVLALLGLVSVVTLITIALMLVLGRL